MYRVFTKLKSYSELGGNAAGNEYNTIQTFVNAPYVTSKSEARDGDD